MAASHQVLETTMLEMDLNKVVVETFSDENKKAMCIQKFLISFMKLTYCESQMCLTSLVLPSYPTSS